MFIGHYIEERERISFMKNFVKNIKTLDMGAAEGILTRNLIDNSNVTAIDIYGDEIKQNPAKNKFIMNINSTDFKNDDFGQVLLLEVIEHQPKEHERLDTIKEAYRVLKNGGNLVLSTPNRKRLSSCIRKIIGREIKFPHLFGTDKERIFGNYRYIEYSAKELKDLCLSVGFKDVKIFYYYLQIPYINLFFKIKTKLCPTLFARCIK